MSDIEIMLLDRALSKPNDIDIVLTGPDDKENIKFILNEGKRIGYEKYNIFVDIVWFENLGNQDIALDFFEKSFQLMLKSNKRYLNEIIYNILLIFLDKDDYAQIKKYLGQYIPNNDSYSKIVDGFNFIYLLIAFFFHHLLI